MKDEAARLRENGPSIADRQMAVRISYEVITAPLVHNPLGGGGMATRLTEHVAQRLHARIQP
ncbi:hypothetical protein N9293_00440 [Planctomycetota bacterium]|nr:hypothetical protein [bacterium]MDB4559349.1 hypothetical protein [Planctomycetota bacterium]